MKSSFAVSNVSRGPLASRHLRLSSSSKQFLVRNSDFLKEMEFLKFHHLFFILFATLEEHVGTTVSHVHAAHYPLATWFCKQFVVLRCQQVHTLAVTAS